MAVKFLSRLGQWGFMIGALGGSGICGATSEQVANDCLYKFTEHYCSQSQANFTEALEKCKDYASLLAKGCIKAGLRKGYKVPEVLKEKYPLLIEILQSDIEEVKKKKKKKEDGGSHHPIAKENLIARCQTVRQKIIVLLTKRGVNPASDPLMIQVEKLLAGLVEAPQVDALLLLQAGQCDGIGEAVAWLPDNQLSSGIEAPCLRPPSQRQAPLIKDEEPVSQGKGKVPSPFSSSEPSDQEDKTPGLEPDKIHSPGGVYASGQLPLENNKDKDLLP